MTTATKEQANGTVIQELSANVPAQATPQERIQAFGQELAALCQKYGVQMQPFIKSYNGGQQIADVEFVAVGK